MSTIGCLLSGARPATVRLGVPGAAAASYRLTRAGGTPHECGTLPVPRRRPHSPWDTCREPFKNGTEWRMLAWLPAT